jgi:starch-binding outer membrane protein, SusD/RagB family
MKKIKSFLILLALLTGTFSCKKSLLNETPLDFLSATNAFKTAADFQASVNNLYRLVRAEFYTTNDNDPMEYQYRTDIAFYVPAAFPANLSG